MFFLETPLRNHPNNLILFTDIESPIYSVVTLATYTGCFTKKYT